MHTTHTMIAQKRKEKAPANVPKQALTTTMGIDFSNHNLLQIFDTQCNTLTSNLHRME